MERGSVRETNADPEGNTLGDVRNSPPFISTNTMNRDWTHLSACVWPRKVPDAYGSQCGRTVTELNLRLVSDVCPAELTDTSVLLLYRLVWFSVPAANSPPFSTNRSVSPYILICPWSQWAIVSRERESYAYVVVFKPDNVGDGRDSCCNASAAPTSSIGRLRYSHFRD